MATITPGTAATIRATTAEKQLFHCLLLLQELETSTLYNPTRKDYVQTSFNDNAATFNANFSIPCEPALGTDGKPTFVGSNYLIGYSFNPGTTLGSFKSTSLPAYLVEVLFYCQILESDTATNPNNKNFLTANYDSDRKIFTGNVTLPYTKTIEQTGDVTISIPEYLTTLS